MMHPAGLLLFWMASLALFWAPLDALLRLSLENDRYTHILAIPLISVCLVLWKRSTIFADKRWYPCLGVPLLGLGMLLYVTGLWSRELTVEVLAMIVAWVAGFVLCYGFDTFQGARFPLLLLLLIVPIPQVVMDKIIFLMQTGSSYFCWVFFQLAGTPVYWNRFTFELPQVGIEVAQECSSVHSGWALFITGLLVGHAFLRSFWSKVCLSLLTAPIAVFTNGIRVFTIWFLGTHVDIGFLYGNLHHRGGILFSLISLSVLLAFAALFRKLEGRVLRAPGTVHTFPADGPETAAPSLHA